MVKKIVFIGGPGSGKSSVIKKLTDKGHICYPEISREIILEAKQNGVDQLFLEDPLLFSKKILEKRIIQFEEASKAKTNFIFFDRGIPSITSYLDYSKVKYPDEFHINNKKYRYDQVFYFPFWKDIYCMDNERYETKKQAKLISNHILETYTKLDYSIIEVPFNDIETRCDFILKNSITK